MATGSGSSTVYIRNLDERIKIPELTNTLHEIFSGYGTIIDLVAKSNLRAKGQAFVVFDNAESAATAIEEIQGFELSDKPMQLEFAKTKSDATVKQNGDEQEFELHKRKRLAEKERKQAAEAADKAQRDKLKRPAQPEDGDKAGAAKQLKTGVKSSARQGVVPDEYLPPNKILFLQNLPDDYDVDSLSSIFGRYQGFKEVRLVPGRKGIAFVEYEAEAGAITAKENMGGMALGSEGKPMKVTFQRQ